jgi:hypothetical protein
MNCRNIDTFKSEPADRLGVSNIIGILVLGIALTGIVLVFLDSSIRSVADPAESRQIVRALGLNGLSLEPSGRPLRNVGAINPSIDLRFDPKLGRIHLDDADFIFKRSD